MTKVKEYKAVEGDTLDELNEEVNKLLLDDWEPFGGIAVTVLHTEWENSRKGYTESATTYSYVQAMVKRHDPL